MKMRKKNMYRRASLMASLIAVCGTVAFAQSENTVTVNFDDGDGITGELLETTDTGIRLDTIMGAVTIPFDGVVCIGAACPDAIRYVSEDEPVVLTALDGSIRLTGNLLGIEEDQFVLATEVGELRIDLAKARCDGAACPAPAAAPELGGFVALVHGAMNVEGTLIGLEDDAYLIETELLGTVRVTRDASCTGDGCPQG